MLEQAEDLRLDVLHLHNSIDPRCRAAVPMVRTMHGHWPYCPSGSRYLKRPGVACQRAYSLGGCLWGHVVNRCGSVRPARLAEDFRRTWKEMSQPREILTLAISDFVRQQMIRSGHCGQRIRVLHLPAPLVDLPELPESAPPTFLFLGRLVPEKGAAWLIRAFARVKSDARLEIAGDGPERPALEALARSAGVADGVHFAGWLDVSAAMQHLQSARAAVMPSVWHEPAGLVTLEAAAMGKAAVVSCIGGIPEYASRLGNCRLVTPDDEAALASEIETLASDSALAGELGQTGRRNAQLYFGIDAHLAQLDQAYRDAKELRQ
jgi:glycosyltransferase involved in cell wall biosynthesis